MTTSKLGSAGSYLGLGTKRRLLGFFIVIVALYSQFELAESQHGDNYHRGGELFVI